MKSTQELRELLDECSTAIRLGSDISKPDALTRSGKLQHGDIIGVGVSVAGSGRNRTARSEQFLDIYIARDQTPEDPDRLVPRIGPGGLACRVVPVGSMALAAFSPAPRGRHFRPLQPGAAISSADGNRCGSLGCFVGDDGGDLFFVTAGHCVADAVGKKVDVHQPASKYSAPSAQTHCGFVRVAERSGLIDAALVQLNSTVSWSNRLPLGESVGRTPVDPPRRQPAFKYGQWTGGREGRLRSLVANFVVDDGLGTSPRLIQSQYLFYNATCARGAPRAASPFSFAGPGDSGALVTDAQGRPIGMLIAANPQVAVVTPFNAIISELSKKHGRPLTVV